MVDFNSDAEYFDFEDNIFTSSMFKHTEKMMSSDQYKKTIDENIKSYNESLYIFNCEISELTEDLKTMEWVTKLVIKKVGLTSINNLPPNLVELSVIGNNIRILDGAVLPSTLKSLDWIDNKTRDVVGLQDGIVFLQLKDNYISEISSAIPKTVEKIDVSGNKCLITLPIIPEGCCYANFTCTSITNIDTLPDSIEELHTCRCNIPIVNKLPKNLKVWKNFISGLKSITCKWPSDIIEVDLYNNNVSYVPDFPPTCETVDLGNNALRAVPKFPSTVLSFNIKDNEALELSDEFKAQYRDSSNVQFDEYVSRRSMRQMTYTPNLSMWQQYLIQSQTKRDKTMICDDSNPHYIPLPRVFSL